MSASWPRTTAKLAEAPNPKAITVIARRDCPVMQIVRDLENVAQEWHSKPIWPALVMIACPSKVHLL